MWISERSPSTTPPATAWRDARAYGPERDRLRGWVERLAVPRHFAAEPRGNARTCAALHDELSLRGYRVDVQGRYRNVVALPVGLAANQPVTLVAAHYDTVPGCPGADDNASALAVLLECARVMGRDAARVGLGFAAFNAEEDGLLGSRDFVATTLPQFAHPIGAVHVLEMVGYRGCRPGLQTAPLPWIPRALRTPDFLALLARGASNSIVRRVDALRAAPALRVVGARTWGPLHALLPDLARSDHFPFWMARVPAVLWTDTGNFRNPHYHRRSDTPDTLDYEFMTDVAELLCALLVDGAARGASSEASPTRAATP